MTQIAMEYTVAMVTSGERNFCLATSKLHSLTYLQSNFNYNF